MASGLTKNPGIYDGLSGISKNTGISAGSGISGNPVGGGGTTFYLTNDAATQQLTNDAGTLNITSQ